MFICLMLLKFELEGNVQVRGKNGSYQQADSLALNGLEEKMLRTFAFSYAAIRLYRQQISGL